MFNVPEKEVGEAIIFVTMENRNPSVHEMALGFSIILFHAMVEIECDGSMVISLSEALTHLVALDRTDLAMSLIFGLCGDYDLVMPSEFMQYAVFGPVAKAFIAELTFDLGKMVEENEKELMDLGS